MKIILFLLALPLLAQVPAVNSGTATYPSSGAIPSSTTATALANGTTATTQSQNDNSTKPSTTAYTDLAVANAVSGVNPAVAVLAASTASLTGTYNNGTAGVGAFFTVTATGAFTLDGVSIGTVGQRVLLKDQSSGFQNGIYTATVVGSVGVSPIFTRALDYNSPSNINSTGAIPVQSGTVNALTSWLLTSTVTTVGTDALTYSRFSVNPANEVLAVSPGAGICRFAGSTQTCTSSELSGDATTSGSNAVTVSKINGTSFAGTNGHLVSFGASNIPADSGVVAANAVVASSPGAGVAHFAGSTQTVTSSPVVNADVTSIDAATKLTGITPVANGGWGLATLTAHALYAGNATTAPTAVGPDASTTKALFSAGSSADPAFRAIASADLPATVVRTDQSNTYSTGAQDMGSATSHKVPTSAGAAPSASGQVAVDSTRGTFKVYDDLLATANPLETVPSIQLGSSDTLTCSTIGANTPTNFATTYTIPANTLIANKGFKVSVGFQVTGQSTPSFTFDMLLGTTVVYTGPSAGATVTNVGIGAILLVQGTAAAGASVNVNTSLIGSGGLGILVRNNLAQPVAVATNANKAVTFRLTCSTNTAGNSVTLQQLLVESVN